MGKNAIKILNTIEKAAPQCGILVKNITFRDNFNQLLNVLASITKPCLQVEEVHTLKSTEEKLLWLFLISDEFRPAHLQLITTSKQNFRTKLTPTLYYQFSDKFKDTLDTLELNLHRFNDPRYSI